MRPRKKSDFDGDGPDLGKATAVGSLPAQEGLVSEEFLFEGVEGLGIDDPLLFFFLGDCGLKVFEHLIDSLLFSLLPFRVDRLKELLGALGLDLFCGLGSDGVLLFHNHLGNADLSLNLFAEGDDSLDLVVGELKGVEHDLFREFVGAALHHHDGVLCTGDDEVEAALLHLGVSRVDHQLFVDVADSDAGHHGGDGNLGEVQGHRGRRDSVDIGVVL